MKPKMVGIFSYHAYAYVLLGIPHPALNQVRAQRLNLRVTAELALQTYFATALSFLGNPETPIAHNTGIYLKSYQGSYYNLRYNPLLRDIGVSGKKLLKGLGFPAHAWRIMGLSN